LPTDPGISGPAIPLARWADRQLRLLASETGSARIAALDGPTIVGERGSNRDFRIDGRVSAGNGGSRLNLARDGVWYALTLLRPQDRELLPALFLGDELDINDTDSIAAAIARHDSAGLLERGRMLGLPVACIDETPVSPPVDMVLKGSRRSRTPGHRPLVIDLSSIWAGPLAGHLLWLAGADVVRVESQDRLDLIRRDDPATFGLLNQGKQSVVIDFSSDAHKAALISWIRRADFVIESSRVRALKHLGIDAEQLVSEVPGLVWLSVTGHGVRGEAAGWVGIGNDCGVAAGLTRAMADASGAIGYVGDALTDPLTGIAGARAAWQAYRSQEACRIILAMTAIGARALAEERAFDADLLDDELRGWAAAFGQPFPKRPRRTMLADLPELGADTKAWLPAC